MKVHQFENDWRPHIDMDVVAESVIDVYENRDNVKGLKMTYEPKYLRFFQAKFESL